VRPGEVVCGGVAVLPCCTRAPPACDRTSVIRWQPRPVPQGRPRPEERKRGRQREAPDSGRCPATHGDRLEPEPVTVRFSGVTSPVFTALMPGSGGGRRASAVAGGGRCCSHRCCQPQRSPRTTWNLSPPCLGAGFRNACCLRREGRLVRRSPSRVPDHPRPRSDRHQGAWPAPVLVRAHPSGSSDLRPTSYAQSAVVTDVASWSRDGLSGLPGSMIRCRQKPRARCTPEYFRRHTLPVYRGLDPARRELAYMSV
jgi:hypothetical protein